MHETDTIKRLIDAVPGRTVAARLRRIMPDIDRRVREGVQHDDIIAVLNANGFNLNLNTFRSCLYRYRKAMREEGAPAAVPVPASTDSDTSAAAPSLADVFDPIRRDALGEKYLGRTRPLFQQGKPQT